MSKVLLLGFSLPTRSGREILQAHNVRSFQFTQALSRAGHEVSFAAKPQPGFVHEHTPPFVERYVEIPFQRPGWRTKLEKLRAEVRPDCCVSSSFLTSYAATFLNWDVPLWFDIYGDPLTEKQASLYYRGDDQGLFSLQSMEWRLLVSGDKFSTCSRPQRYALLGRLGFAGRLNRHTFGYHLVHDIPPGIADIPQPDVAIAGPLVRGSRVKEDDFVLLWAGGYNVWADTETLFKGLAAAMGRDPSVKFISTGGPVVDEKPYRRFLQLVGQSPHRDRFIFLGWVSRTELLQLYQECDSGISTDADCYEAELGTRTRLLEMIGRGMPFISTPSSEIASILARDGFGRLTAVGDSDGLSDIILEMSRKKKSGQSGKKENMAAEARERFAGAHSALVLSEWCRAPAFAPDRKKIVRTARAIASLRGKFRDLKTRYLGIKYKDP